MANFFELWSPLLIFFSPSLGGYQPLLPVCLSLSNLLLAEKPDNQVIREPRRFCLRLNPRTCFLTLGSLFKHLFFHPSSTRDLAGWPSLPLTLLPSAFLNLVFFSLGWLWICSVFNLYCLLWKAQVHLFCEKFTMNHSRDIQWKQGENGSGNLIKSVLWFCSLISVYWLPYLDIPSRLHAQFFPDYTTSSLNEGISLLYAPNQTDTQ